MWYNKQLKSFSLVFTTRRIILGENSDKFGNPRKDGHDYFTNTLIGWTKEYILIKLNLKLKYKISTRSRRIQSSSDVRWEPFIIPHSPPTITAHNKLPSVWGWQCVVAVARISIPSQSITIFQSISCSLSLLIIARFPHPASFSQSAFRMER